MTVVTLDAMTPATVDALARGEVVVLPVAVLDAIDSGRDGQLRDLERHLAHGRPGPHPIALSIPCVHRVVVWSARAYYEQRPAGPDISRVIMRVVAGGADSEAGEQFTAALRDVNDGAPVQVLDVDALVAAGALAWSGSVITAGTLVEGAASWVVLDAIAPAPLPPVRPALERAIRDTAVTYPRCRCVLHARLTDDELVRLGAGCTDPTFACPRLDTVRRRVL